MPTAPKGWEFCNLELSLDQGARTKVAETVAKLKRSKVYFQALTDRVNNSRNEGSDLIEPEGDALGN